MIRCHIEANPQIQFVTWTKDKRIYDPFDIPGVMAMENGSILIDRVRICTTISLIHKFFDFYYFHIFVFKGD